MSISIDVDPVDIEEMDMHDGEDIGINVYGSINGGSMPCLGFVSIESENGKIKIVVNNLENVIIEDEDGNPI